jgi:ATP-dependent Clp protease ATP-binding subunit ClpC
MGTLNPDLLAKDFDAVLNDAVALKDEFRKPTILPELVLLALLRRKETAADRLLNVFATSRGVDLPRLDRQAYLAAERARDQNGSLDFIAAGNRQVPLSRQTIILIDDALSEANARDEVRVDTDHVLLVLSESAMTTSGILRQHGITPKAITDIMGDKQQYGTKSSDSTAEDYVAKAKAGELRAVYFREDLLRDMINILTQSINRHIILMGPDGVGKRTLAYSLGLLISEGKGPNGIKSLVQIDETALLDNDHQAVRAGMSRARGGILFIPHLHRFFGGPVKADFTKSTPQIQKAFLDDDPIIIATTTEVEYNARIASVMAITENSQVLRVPEPSVEETIEILKIIKPHLEADYQLEIANDALQLAARLAKRYLGTTPLPRSAEHLLHRTAAMVNMSKQTHLAFKPDIKEHSMLDSEDITLTASQMTGIPVNKLGEDERVRYASMVEHIQERLIGQEEAVLAVSRAIKTARVGLKEARRPIGAFLFLGPTGVGKTELARALAEFMFGNEDAMLPLDMSEFQDESSLNRLIGSPTGYVGSEEGGQLTERVKRQPYIIVLFDEVEKAHPRVLDILLQMIEEGRLTDGRGNTTNFSETVIILTSNLGSEHLAVPVINDEIREEVMDEVRSFFRPEFLNRLDEVIMFSALTPEDLYNIIKLMLKKEGKMASDRGLKLEFSEEAVQWLLAQNDQPEYGARPLQRIIRRYVREPLADFLLRANPPAGTSVRIDSDTTGLTFAAVAEDGKEYTVQK